MLLVCYGGLFVCCCFLYWFVVDRLVNVLSVDRKVRLCVKPCRRSCCTKRLVDLTVWVYFDAAAHCGSARP